MAVIAFPTVATWRGEPAFSAEEVLDGLAPNLAARDKPGRLWLELDGAADCLRFYGHAVEGEASPLVYLEGDASRRDRGAWVLFDGYTRQTPAGLQSWAQQVAVAAGRTFVVLARPGVYGSSGNHQHRRREREVALVDAALTALARRFAWQRIDLAGLSGGGHLVACLLARRSDIGRAVIASGNVAVRRRNLEMGRVADVTGFSDFVDPIDLAAEVARHPPHRLVVLSDPEDSVVSAACQRAYVEALAAQGVRIEHRLVPALDAAHHVLRDAALLASVAP